MGSQPIKEALQGVRSKRCPRWFMRQAGRYLPEYKQTRAKFERFTDFLFSTPDIVEVTLQPLDRFDLDAAIIFSDILVVPMILGSDLEFVENHGPRLSTISNPEDFQKLKTGSLEKCFPIYEALQQVRSRLDPSKSLIGFAGGPWTVASYMIEGKTSKTFLDSKTFAYRWPDVFQQLLERICDVTADHLIAQVKAGADVVKIFDSWAGAVPFHKTNEWIIEPHRRIIEKLNKACPETPIISFAKGAESIYVDYIKTTRVGGVALGPSARLRTMVEVLPKQTALQGALDPSLLVVGGDEMVKEIEFQYELFKNHPHIFNLGHGIVPETPIDNVHLALKTLDRISA